MFLVEARMGLLRPARCLACGVPVAWPCCAGCLPSEPGAVGPWLLAADPEVGLWTLGPYRDALRTAVLARKLDGQPAAPDEPGRPLRAPLALPLVDRLAPAGGRDRGRARGVARASPPPRPPPAPRHRLAGGRVL